jgi:hypothetical protein
MSEKIARSAKVWSRRMRTSLLASLAVVAGCAAPSGDAPSVTAGGICEGTDPATTAAAPAPAPAPIPTSAGYAPAGAATAGLEPTAPVAAAVADPTTAGTTAALVAGGDFSRAITVRLQKTLPGASVLSFGLPVPAGVLADASSVRFAVAGTPVAANVKVLLPDLDAAGNTRGVASLLVQLPASVMPAATLDLQVTWKGGAGPAPGTNTLPFATAGVSGVSEEVVPTTTRTIAAAAGTYKIVDTGTTNKALFAGREPAVIATFPEGYLAATGIIGEQVTAAQAAAPGNAGLAFLSDAASKFGRSAMYAEGYGAHPEAIIDPVTNYEGWLYDRCATFLGMYAHNGDTKFLRHALRSCSYYSGKIGTSGANLGICTIKQFPDLKYSHSRGLYAYYALTGDENAFAAAKAMADMWLTEPTFVVPYRQGRLRGVDKIWTERLLGTSLEGLIYGHRLTGDPKYLTAVKEIVATAHKHITGDAATLASLNPGVAFPPQNCFIHSALQHTEGESTQPWCSSWMSELVVDSLLRYQRQTNDEKVDEIFIRLVRFLRDTGSQYKRGNPEDDYFMKPKSCFDASAGIGARRLVPIYGTGLTANGTRANYGEWDDDEHCADATALTAAGLRALKRRKAFDANPVGPFASEGQSFVQLHHEFAFCAKLNFENWSRTKRDPANWTSKELAAGAADPAGFISRNKIGFPSHGTSPQRKLSWWFNMSLLQYALLAEAGIEFPQLKPGAIQPAGCAK